MWSFNKWSFNKKQLAVPVYEVEMGAADFSAYLNEPINSFNELLVMLNCDLSIKI